MRLLDLFLVLLSTIVHNVLSTDYMDVRYKALNPGLQAAKSIQPAPPGYIPVAVLILNLEQDNLGATHVQHFNNLLKSIYSSSKGTPIYLLLITDEESRQSIENVVLSSLGKFVAEPVIRSSRTSKQLTSTLPTLSVQLVDIESITEHHREAIDEMKLYFSMGKGDRTETLEDGSTHRFVYKYFQDLFFLAPFYPEEFLNLKRLIVLDADTEVVEDMISLYKIADDMKESELVAVARDPDCVGGYYRNAVVDLLQRGMISRTEPRLHHGINTGVVLYDLEKMRQSSIYQHEVQRSSYVKLVDYLDTYKLICGDQDWFNFLRWKYSHMFLDLPCEYNSFVEGCDQPCLNKPKIKHI